MGSQAAVLLLTLLAALGTGLVLSPAAAEVPAPSVRLTEFLAGNSRGIKDADAERSDWIELHNASATAVNLAGWGLTDDADRPHRWRFPATNIAAGAYLVVFASGKDRATPGAELHTNFRLRAAGGYLALHWPDGTVVDEYRPGYPPQRTDVSFGIESSGATDALVPIGARVRFQAPADATSGWRWTGGTEPFDDSLAAGWREGVMPIGYDLQDTVAGPPVEITGPPVQPRGIYDTATGSVFVLASDGFSQVGEVTEWRVYSVVNRTLTPLILRLDTSGDYEIAGIGASRTSNGSGEQTFPFALQAGSARVGSGFFLGWKDGSNGTDNTGVPAWDESSTSAIRWFQQHTRFTVGENLGAGQFFGRAYSLQASVRAALGGRIQTDVRAPMYERQSSLYLRVPFVVEPPHPLIGLGLSVSFNDGFVSWLNGQEIVRRNAPADLAYNAAARTNRTVEQSLVAEEIDLTPFLGLLRSGTNLLAFQGLNEAASSPEFFLAPELRARRAPGGAQRFFAEPTPGSANGRGFDGWLPDLVVVPSRGVFFEPQSVSLSGPALATIRYTTDGTGPTAEHGTVYIGPLQVSQTTTLRTVAVRPGFIARAVATHTFVFPASTARQPARPPGYPETWSGARADYEVDPAVVGQALPPFSFTNALSALPSLCLTADPADLFGAGLGIYSNSAQSGSAWERAAAVELLFPDGQPGFQTDAGVRVGGDYSSGHGATPKHSLRITFKSEYGPPTLRFPLFSDSPVTTFDQLFLRACSTDSWPIEDPPNRSGDGSTRWWRTKATYMRDQWMRDTMRDLGRPTAHGRYVHVYLDGLYWGVYNLVERLNDGWNEALFGGDKSEYDVLKDYGEVEAGDRRAWNEMMALVATGFPGEAEYQRLQGNDPNGARNPAYPVYLGVGNFIDYMVLHIYAGAEDWPAHNWWGSRRRGPNSEGFRFYVWDQEITNDDLSRRVTLWGERFEAVTAANSPGIIYDRLRRNLSFRQRFRDRVQELLFNDGPLTPVQCAARWLARQRELDQAIVAESARWGDARREPPYTRERDWVTEMDWQRNAYWPSNHAVATQRFRNVGLFPVLSPPQLGHPGGAVADGYPLTIAHTNSIGTIHFTTDGTDPRGPAGVAGAAAQTYTQPVRLHAPTHLRARVRTGNDWSAAVEADFLIIASDLDTDQDGLPDVWEWAHGLDRNDPRDAVADSDRDGLTNRGEWLAGTDPADPLSRLHLEILSSASTVLLRFATVAQRTYTLQATPTLTPPAWTNVVQLPSLATGTIQHVLAPLAPEPRFYRLTTP